MIDICDKRWQTIFCNLWFHQNLRKRFQIMSRKHDFLTLIPYNPQIKIFSKKKKNTQKRHFLHIINLQLCAKNQNCPMSRFRELHRTNARILLVRSVSSPNWVFCTFCWYKYFLTEARRTFCDGEAWWNRPGLCEARRNYCDGETWGNHPGWVALPH